jgi:hypothetical protein
MHETNDRELRSSPLSANGEMNQGAPLGIRAIGGEKKAF